MPIVKISFTSPAILTGVNFDPAATGTASVAQILRNFSDTPVSILAPGFPIAGDNLTSETPLIVNGPTAWRITNAGAAANVTLSRYGGGFSNSFSLLGNSLTFVRGGAAGTYQLSGDTNNTIPKASSNKTPNEIWKFATGNLVTNDFYDITGSDFNDTLSGANSSDILLGGNGNDVLFGLLDLDTLDGGEGHDSLDGGADDDSLTGGNGNDTLLGATGFDTLLGGSGDDTLNGGTGSDNLTGGTGADRFAYTASNQGIDTITDFTIADSDVIQISASGVGFSGGGLTPGTLLSTQFLGGAGVVAATDTDQRFLYNTNDGALRFDADGTGSLFATVQLATLTGAPSITNTQIVIV
ncbi:calcium-binding protein [Microcystis aeruginosa]|uniref:calcium-binding protein n=1 Tax=Microcystis aeruginosa TaxID=1126 RepID=UPI00232E7152|nr:calcium-binding protein [Microcystis aeruginosa]MDB9388767.1 calcium-binding protein [Microcystis aeruginosa CS-583]